MSEGVSLLLVSHQINLEYPQGVHMHTHSQILRDKRNIGLIYMGSFVIEKLEIKCQIKRKWLDSTRQMLDSH